MAPLPVDAGYTVRTRGVGRDVDAPPATRDDGRDDLRLTESDDQAGAGVDRAAIAELGIVASRGPLVLTPGGLGARRPRGTARPVSAATRAVFGMLHLHRPGLTFTRTAQPSTSTS